MKKENTDNKGFAFSSFPHHGCLADEKKDRTNGISSFLLVSHLMKDYPTDCQTLAYAYHQIISLSGSTSSSGRTMHMIRQYTTGLMLAQTRVFPTGVKYRSLLGDFPSRTNKLVLKIPNRPRVLHPSGLPAKTVGRSRTQTEAKSEHNGISNK